MARKRMMAEHIIIKLREAEVGLAQGQTVGQVCKQIGVTEQTYYRWRKVCPCHDRQHTLPLQDH